MHIVKKHNRFKQRRRFVKPFRVILHHTAGGTLRGAQSTLINRGLGYHYMIEKNGTVHEYVPADKWTPHAYKANRGTVGVSFVGGGKYGAMSDEQYNSVIELLKVLKDTYPTITEVSGHKHVDNRGWKIDPRMPGEPANGVDFNIDKKYMDKIACKSGLKFVSKKDLFGA